MEAATKKSEVKNTEVVPEKTQAFLNSAISDLAGWIRFSDAKVSVIMAAVGVLVAGIINCRNDIVDILKTVQPCSWIGLTLYICMIVFALCLVMVYYWGIQTLKPRISNLNYQSRWFIDSKQSFDEYKTAVLSMTVENVIEDMAAELYKLNDINRRKSVAFKHTLNAFIIALLSAGIWLLLVLITVA